VLNGGAGNDTLIADAGNDTLTGGAGGDALFYTGAAGAAVVITDFAPGEDLMDLAASLGIADGLQARLLLQQSGANVVLPLGSGRSVTFLDHLVADFTADDFQIV
jgi:Ca2+-binding RTX toxin-like protein